tara:strand:+ start:23 stop:880 length:858 start_codon:yes stop_codon:yes gene_type:complete
MNYPKRNKIIQFLYIFTFIFSLLVINCNNNDNRNDSLKPNIVSIFEKKTSSHKSIQTSKDRKKLPLKTQPNSIRKSFLIGKIDYASDTSFVLLDKKYHNKSLMYLEKETAKAFIQMYQAAKNDGINLLVVSGARNYYSQKSIWERKFNRNLQAGLSPIENAIKILKYSSMPSTSRHHWGTEVDINNLEPSYFESGNGKLEYDWLNKNAGKFGFCQVYSKFDEKDRTTGYQIEAWHWSYIPKSRYFLDKYNELVDYEDINGFLGSLLAKELNMIEEYVNGISSACY